MAATNYTPIQLYYSTTASAAPTAGNLVNGELAINITDGKLYYKDNGGTVQVIATKGAGTIGGSNTQIQFNDGGALAGNAAMVFNKSTNVTTLTTLNLTNALGATYGGTAQSAYAQGDLLYASAVNTLSKLTIGTVNYILTSTGSVPQWVAPSSVTVQTANNLAGGAGGSVPYQSAADTTTFLAIGAANRVMTSSGSAPQWVTSLTGLTGVSSSSMTNTSLTSGRLVYSTTGGAQTDSANLTFNGTTLSMTGLSNTGFSTIVKTVTLGDSNFNGSAVFAPATPAKLYIGTGTVTDVTSAASATNTTGAVTAFGITPIAATNTAVTYTNASTLYIAGAPTASTNITITNPYAFYVAGGASYFGGAVDFAVTPSYSGGTANGVMYLNASKQITTGSALTFDGSANFSFTGSGLYPLIAVSPTGNNAIFGFRMDASAGNGIDWRMEQGRSAVGDFNISAPAVNAAPQYVILKNLSAQYWSIGSAGEQMRLNATGLGVGTNSPQAKLELGGTNPNMYFGPVATGSGAYLSYNTAGNYFAINAVTQGVGYRNIALANDGGNVGIGTSSPAQKLQVHGAIYANNSTNVAFLMQGSQYNGSIANTSTANTYSLGYTTDASTHTSVLYWNASGNLGLGLAPSAWLSTNKAFQFGYGAVRAFTNSANTYLDNNNYVNTSGTDIYLNSGYAGRYRIADNQHIWYQAASGTAGNAISFTQAMTLNANGQLLVGGTAAPASGEIKAVLTGGAYAGPSYLTFQNNSTNSGCTIGTGGADIRFYTNTGATGSESYSERARIDSDGAFIVGTTIPTTTFKTVAVGNGSNVGTMTNDVGYNDFGMGSNTYFNTTWKYAKTGECASLFRCYGYGGTFLWQRAGSGTANANISWTTAMTLDGGANLLVGQTDRGLKNSNSFDLDVSDGSAYINHVSGTPTGSTFVYFGYNAGSIGSISQNGVSQVLYNVSSDYRLKNIIGPVANSGAYIDSLKPVEGTWKADGSTFVGLIAHEAQEVSRTQIATGKKDGEQMQGMDYSNSEFIANIIAELQSLRKRVAQLESK